MDKEEKPIYMITGYELYNGKRGDKVSWGFYYSFEDAENVVASNCTDLYEGCYNIMIIEELFPGIIAGNFDKVSFYKWNEKSQCYEHIERPKEFEHICCFFS